MTPSIKNFIKKYGGKAIRWVAICVAFIALSFVSYAIYDSIMYGPSDSADQSVAETNSECSVLGINLHGELYTYIPKTSTEDSSGGDDVVASEQIMNSIDQANNDENIKGIIIEVDSPGGYPVAGEEIADAIKASKKPVVAFIRQSGTSAAYWAVTSADQIFASKNSDIGSIGVTISYLDNVGKNEKAGISYVQLSAGKYKDAGSPDKPLTAEEKALIIRDLKIIHENFIEDVSGNRNIPIEKVRAIADGSSVLGERAKELGLIDEIGGYSEAKSYMEKKIGEKADVCWQ
jgi:signal peptide peptidase SppA